MVNRLDAKVGDTVEFPVALVVDGAKVTLGAKDLAKISVKGDTLTYTGYSVNDDGTLSVIYNEPSDDLLLVKILVPIAGVILIAGIVVAVVLVKKNKAKKAAADTGSFGEGSDAE